MRKEEVEAALKVPQMDEGTCDALMEHATDLAYDAFGQETTDDHIEWAYQRLVMHWRWGLPAAGVVTVH